MTRIIRCDARGQVCAGYHTRAHRIRKNNWKTRKGRGLPRVITVSRVGQGRGIPRPRRRAAPAAVAALAPMNNHIRFAD
jgi:hypothetical protein